MLLRPSFSNLYVSFLYCLSHETGLEMVLLKIHYADELRGVFRQHQHQHQDQQQQQQQQQKKRIQSLRRESNV